MNIVSVVTRPFVRWGLEKKLAELETLHRELCDERDRHLEKQEIGESCLCISALARLDDRIEAVEQELSRC